MSRYPSWLKGAGSTIVDLGKRALGALLGAGKAVGDAILGTEVHSATPGSPNDTVYRQGGLLGRGGTADRLLNGYDERYQTGTYDNTSAPIRRLYGTPENDIADGPSAKSRIAGYEQSPTYGTRHVNGLLDYGRQAWDTVSGAAENAWNTISGIPGQIGGAAENAWNTISGIPGQIGNAADRFYNGYDTTYDKPLYAPDTENGGDKVVGQRSVTEHTNGLRENVENGWNNFTGGIQNGWNNFTGAVSNAAQGVGNAFNSAGATMAKQPIRNLTGYSLVSALVNDPDTGEPGALVQTGNGSYAIVYRDINGRATSFRVLDENDMKSFNRQ